MGKILTRMGDGSPVEIPEAEIMQDIIDGSTDASERGGIPALNDEEVKYLFDIFKRQDRFVSVQQGNEVVMSYDAGTLKIRRHGLIEERIASLQMYEKFMGADTAELCHVDYSYKPLKPIVAYEQTILEQALLVTHVPLFYGAMPNLGLYSHPDGPFPNPSELMPMGKITEAMESYDLAVEDAVTDILFTAESMIASGADGINLDTVGAAGDADFKAGLIATRKLRDKYPDICIEMGMAGEFVLGMHGSMEYNGRRLAGLYPHQQVKLAQDAGVSIFGPVCNTNTSMSSPWNIARAITFMKECCEVATIPIHVNMGMGVGSVTVNEHPPVDITSRASTAMVELCKLDGL
ncbi:MAG: [dimethylamine--corrinoid protein] Co-methyltransferase [Desulfobacterales bacterium]|nr:[dimethylamine--corrinoid protein] Co-methyltransferase [Desulfobacterales bacterium]